MPPSPTSVMLVNGRYFDHLAPDPGVIDLDVLDHGLRAPRFNNQTTRPISIAEHSMRVRRIAVELVPEDTSFAGAVVLDAVHTWSLLHDAHEALVPWGDCLRPGKTAAMKVAEAVVDRAIAEALGLDWDQDVLPAVDVVKTADEIALYFEAMLWQPGASDWAPSLLESIDEMMGAPAYRGAYIEQFIPLIAPRPGESWRAGVEELLS